MKRYMIVDDDPINNLISKINIQKFDAAAQIKIFSKPIDALDFIKNEKNPKETILLLDINMPKMTGWDFLKEFRTFHDERLSKYSVFILSSSLEDFSSKKEEFPFLKNIFSKPLRQQHLAEAELAFSEINRKIVAKESEQGGGRLTL